MSFFKQFPLIDYDIMADGSITKMVNIFRTVRPVQKFIDNPSLYKFYEIKNGERPDIVSQQLYGTPDFYWTFFVINDFLHDGYKAWPLSQEQIFKYIEKEYNGYAINTRITFIDNDIQNSLAGKFTVGETITGDVSGATGTLTKKDLDLNQLIVQNMTTNVAFQGLRDDESGNTPPEFISGSKTFDEVSTYQVWPYAEAPHHYFITDDEGVERQYTNSLFHEDNYEATKTNAELSYTSNRQYIYDLNDKRSKIRVINPTMIGEFIDTFESLINE